MAQPLRAVSLLSPETWRRIEEVLERTPRTMILHFLKYRLKDRDVGAGTHDSAEGIIDRIHGYCEEGLLGIAEMFEALLDFFEYQNKSIYLYQIGERDRRKLGRLELPEFVDDLADAAIKTRPWQPVVSYSFRDAEMLRVSFAETHVRPQINLATGEIFRKEVDRIVVLEVERRSGVVALRFDPSARPYVRRGSASNYYQYYKAKAEKILETILQPLDLGDKLAELEGSALVRLPSGTFLTADGRIDLADEDYRGMTVYEAVRQASVAKHSGRYFWRPEEDLGHKLGVEREGLLREVHTEIQAFPAMVRFTADVVRPEVEYVFRHLL